MAQRRSWVAAAAACCRQQLGRPRDQQASRLVNKPSRACRAFQGFVHGRPLGHGGRGNKQRDPAGAQQLRSAHGARKVEPRPGERPGC